MSSKFQGYGKTSNTNNKRTMQALYKLASSRPDVQWIATEKVDGANFSIRVDTSSGEVRCARRRGLLNPGESFYGWEALVYGRADGEVEGKLEGAAQAVAAAYFDFQAYGPDLLEVVIFGEICGGSYPGFKSCIKPVQNRVHYNHERAFIAFDIMLRYDKRCVFVNPFRARRVLRREGFEVTPCVEYSMDPAQLLAIPPTQDTLVPYLFELPWIPGNTAEGFVIVPCVDQEIVPGVDENRIAVKIKSAAFSEGGARVKARKAAGPQTPEEAEAEAALLGLICESRFCSVRSKELEGAHPMKLASLLVKDAFEDMDADLIKALHPKSARCLRQSVQRVAGKRVEGWLAAA